MGEIEKKFKSYNLNKYDIEISNTVMDCRVFWARIVSHENESLFTQYTKHTFYELQYAVNGHIGMVTDKEKLFIPESHFTVIPPDTYHQVIDADSKGARFIIAFSIELKEDKLRHAFSKAEASTLYMETVYMRPLLNLILEKNSEHGIIKKRSLSVLLESLLIEVIERICSKSGISATDFDSQSNHNKVNEIQSVIQHCSGIGIKVSDLAARFHISERHLCRLFTEELGKTPSEVIGHEKLKKIEEYITSTNLSLGEISELCGFCDEYAMNKFFKKQTKTNLSQFKKLAKS